MKYIKSIALMLFSTAVVVAGPAEKVDFRYAPPEWQTAVCLPDDPLKTLVDKSGELLYHYTGKPGREEFATRISVVVDEKAQWKSQELLSPKVPVVKTLREAPGLEIEEEAFALPAEDADRPDFVLFRVKNTGTGARSVRPKLVVENRHSTAPAVYLVDAGGKPVGTLEIPSGGTVRFALQHGGKALSFDRIVAARDAVPAYWEHHPKLPYGSIQVPDSGIQSLLDSSVRNIWQAREIKNGMTCFHVGPTIYRSLWVVDGAFLLETATMLGAGNQARDGILTLLSHQKDDGRIEVMQDKYGYWKENGLVIWACLRHARLTGDKAWFESVWPKLRRVAGFIKVLRTDTPVPCKDKVIPRAPHNDLDRGLMPHGIIDGGIQNGVDYSNTYWNLIGLAACIEGAAWLGKDAEAAEWKKEYDDFNAVFRKAVARDLWKDSNGNNYLPMVMGAPGREQLPQRAQWSFCHAVYPGRLFAKDDPVAQGTLAMLRATEQEGMVHGTGWDAKGIWTYFGSFYAHAWLEMGDGKKAAGQLYAFANHAAPPLVWREEQSLKGADFHKVGDMPHNWASAEFIRLVVHLLALDRGDELHLLEGIPAEWLKPGMVTRLERIATPFGPFSMTLQVNADGTKATLATCPLKSGCRAIVIHSPGGGVTKLDASQNHSITLSL